MPRREQLPATASSVIGITRLNRRRVLRRSAMGLALPAALAATGWSATPAGAQSAATPATTGAADSGYVTIGDLELYYARYGGGAATPLLLLHGGLLTSDMAFSAMIPQLARARPVITVDLEGHGHTALVDRPLSFDQMADDVATLLGELSIDQVDVFGYSVGGAVAWQLVFRHPGLVRKLIVASAPFASEGWAPEIFGAMASLGPDAAAAMEATPLYTAYAAVAPNPGDWPELVTKVGELNTGQPYDWSEQIAAITVPTLYIVGDADSVLPEHTVELFRLLGGGVVGDLAPLPTAQLAVLPGTGHSAVLLRVDVLVPLIIDFLDASIPEDQ
ncbi:MAG: alpha/beta hydrolase [Chloroflexota bacterium]|nr:alpha/beta hydrolase [Chloroflexota bacterium]